ncbi:hypothetical protein ES703_83100 [subsurface metagenome]
MKGRSFYSFQYRLVRLALLEGRVGLLRQPHPFFYQSIGHTFNVTPDSTTN